jgi:hypothetical protein
MPDALQAGGSGAEIGVSADPRREAAPALSDAITPLERLLASLPAEHPGLDAARAAIASLAASMTRSSRPGNASRPPSMLCPTPSPCTTPTAASSR